MPRARARYFMLLLFYQFIVRPAAQRGAVWQDFFFCRGFRSFCLVFFSFFLFFSVCVRKTRNVHTTNTHTHHVCTQTIQQKEGKIDDIIKGFNVAKPKPTKKKNIFDDFENGQLLKSVYNGKRTYCS